MEDQTPILTLEPLIEAVREGLESCGWKLSGLQKTTSHEFEGRWAGDSSRSAYLFFHRPGPLGDVSVDVFLDETSKGLRGNLALVFDAPKLGHLPEHHVLLDTLRAAATESLPGGYRVPISVRVRSAKAGVAAADADTEVRVKLVVPRAAFEAGYDAVSSLSSSSARAFEGLVANPDVQALILGDD